MKIGDKTLVGGVLAAATRAANWLSKDAEVSVALLLPYGDKLWKQFISRYNIIEGPEHDVLTRYHLAADRYDADYVVRLTGDCAWMTSRMIAQVIRDCLKYKADYCGNVLVRTFMEGLDVEVISRLLLEDISETTVNPLHREHVTSAIVEQIGFGTLDKKYKVHTVLSEYDMSMIKTSIDTRDEFDRANDMFDKFKQKKELAMTYGSTSN
jgi:spore coat polysaccharide biosynthesis protein SpsF (cytidylyltransferase family)